MKWGRLHDENRQGYRYFVTNEFQCFFEGSHAHVTVSQYTFYIAYIIALFGSMQLGAFCIFQRFFKKFAPYFGIWKSRLYYPAKRGGTTYLSIRKEVRTWNLIARNFRSNVFSKVSVKGYCTMKPVMPMMKSGGAEKSLCLFLISPCMKNSSFTLMTNIFKTKKQSRAINRQERKSRRSCCWKLSVLCRKKREKSFFCITSRAWLMLRLENSSICHAARYSTDGQALLTIWNSIWRNM